MKKSLLSFFFILLILSSTSSIQLVTAARIKELRVTVTLTHKFEDTSEIITISGKVTSDEKVIPETLISIQVNDPEGGSVHIALLYSNETGDFYEEFSVKSEVIPGNYTLYLTTSKVGYEDTTLEIPFTLYSHFDLLISPQFIELKPGRIEQCVIDAIPSHPEEISLRIVHSPNFITANLSSPKISPGGNTTLYLNASTIANQGVYNVTIAGIAHGKIRYANVTVSILSIETTSYSVTTTVKTEYRDLYLNPLNLIGLAIVLIIILSVLLIIKYRRKRRGVDLSYMSSAKAIAKLEEMKVLGKIDDETYNRLKKEYESKL